MKFITPWVPSDRIANIIQLEPAILIVCLALSSWVIYRLFLRSLSAQRHINIRKLFRNVMGYLIIFVSSFTAYYALTTFFADIPTISRLAGYIGLVVLFSGAWVIVKTFRILIFEYLFFSHMQVGVPVLLVNLSTLFLYMLIGGWIITEVFNIRVAPIIATSAIFSLVLGLALQDTLGNLFAGVALQLDKPFELGDWIELQSTGNQKWVGQVHEISWRATTLIGLLDETLVIPNRVVAQAEIANFSSKARPFARREIFRIKYGSSIPKAKAAMIRAATSAHPKVQKLPSPLVIVGEAAESWVQLRLIYFLEDYGSQFMINDHVICRVLEELEKDGIELAQPRLVVENGNPTTTSRI